ncbi:zinc-binding dehydrogenase [Geodermatophilus sp. CPCC 205506]|uniref:zinc-binding dehydrogenase n=1 Tax=Geodermatophilus sp. CPCC 205506 TaxID=2936596 RepID=UPI003EEDA8DB
MSTVQSAAHLRASHVIAVDPVELKRETALRLGATQAVATAWVADLGRRCRWHGADVVTVAVGVLTSDVSAAAFEAVGKGGRLVVTARRRRIGLQLVVQGQRITDYNVTVRGALLGSCNSHYDNPHLARLYNEGRLRLDELITRRYTADHVGAGLRPTLLAGQVVRGVIVHDVS